jgi:hypothetical protein
LGQDRVCAGRGLLARAAKQPRHHVQVLASGHGRFDGGILPGQPDGLPYLLRTAADVNVGYPQPPGIWADQRGDGTHEGRLPGAVGAEYGGGLTAAGHQIKPGKSLDLAEPLDHRLGLDDRLSHCFTLLIRPPGTSAFSARRQRPASSWRSAG